MNAFRWIYMIQIDLPTNTLRLFRLFHLPTPPQKSLLSV